MVVLNTEKLIGLIMWPALVLYMASFVLFAPAPIWGLVTIIASTVLALVGWFLILNEELVDNWLRYRRKYRHLKRGGSVEEILP